MKINLLYKDTIRNFKSLVTDHSCCNSLIFFFILIIRVFFRLVFFINQIKIYFHKKDNSLGSTPLYFFWVQFFLYWVFLFIYRNKIQDWYQQFIKKKIMKPGLIPTAMIEFSSWWDEHSLYPFQHPRLEKFWVTLCLSTLDHAFDTCKFNHEDTSYSNSTLADCRITLWLVVPLTKD